MNFHISFNLYWLLLPLTIGLYFWVFTERADERSTGFMPDLGALFRLIVAVIVWLLVLCLLLAVNLTTRA